IFAWNAYHHIPTGTVTLQIEGGTARAEIFGADGKHAVPPFVFPSLTPIELPPAWYRLRVIQPARLTEEYQLLIKEGRQRTVTVGSNDRQLWEPMPIKETLVGDFGLLKISAVPGKPADAPKDPQDPQTERKEPPPAAVIIQRLSQPERPQGDRGWDEP